MFGTSQEAKKEGWFSRRHRTSEAHDNVRNMRENKRIAKLKDARKRNEAAANRSPCEQIRRLDERLGSGIGAKKERARLGALVG
ncbi:MAG: hypothetical protein HYT93_03890 [Parcubacteria group bacterium]|nr:hypothetical protein [Parcubacteria group bacterium]